MNILTSAISGFDIFSIIGLVLALGILIVLIFKRVPVVFAV